MQLLVFVTKNEEKIDELMKRLALSGIRGATVLSSTGMANSLANMDDVPMFQALAAMMRDKMTMSSKTVLFAVKDSKVEEARQKVKEAFGDLSRPNTGILLGIPISFSDGVSDE